MLPTPHVAVKRVTFKQTFSHRLIFNLIDGCGENTSHIAFIPLKSAIHVLITNPSFYLRNEWLLAMCDPFLSRSAGWPTPGKLELVPYLLYNGLAQSDIVYQDVWPSSDTSHPSPISLHHRFLCRSLVCRGPSPTLPSSWLGCFFLIIWIYFFLF